MLATNIPNPIDFCITDVVFKAYTRSTSAYVQATSDPKTNTINKVLQYY